MKKILMIIIISALLISSCTRPVTNQIKQSESLTWWGQNGYTHVKNKGDSIVYQMLMEQTGVDIEFIHPPKGEHRERFIAMVDSDVLPDIITHDFANDYPGGAEQALNDGIIIPLNDVIKNHCPNLSIYLDANPHIKTMISTKDGRIFCFPSILQEKNIRTYMGPYIRQDYLDRVGMQLPTTIDEFYSVLCVFRDELDIVPMTFYGGKIIETDFLIGAYGISWDFYQEDNQVKFGPLEDGFADFMMELKKWYDEGLIAKGTLTDSSRTYYAKSKRGDIGIYMDYVTSIATYSRSIDGAVFTPLSYPVLSRGNTAFSGHLAPVFVPYSSAYISSSNKDIVNTAKLLDYGYSEEGSMLFNFGILGDSYEIIDGEPVYTEDMYNHEDGFSNAVKQYLCAGAYIRDERQFNQMLVLDEQKEAVALWAETQVQQHKLGTLPLTANQAQSIAEFNSLYRDIILEWIKDYCTSKSDVLSVKEFQQMLISVGAEDVITIYQEVLDER